MKKEKFIFTTSKETADILIQHGFVQIGEGGNCWVFLNDRKISFENLKDVALTDKINV